MRGVRTHARDREGDGCRSGARTIVSRDETGHPQPDDVVLNSADLSERDGIRRAECAICSQVKRLLNSRCPLAASLLIRALATRLASSLSEASAV
jgi:hypothetical protein